MLALWRFLGVSPQVMGAGSHAVAKPNKPHAADGMGVRGNP